MKKIIHKNQILVTTLALMIAVAGYLNYSGTIFNITDESEEVSYDLVNQELLDISDEDIEASATEEIESYDLDIEASAEDGEIPGEAVLTSSSSIELISSAKVSREQARAASKETLQEIIDNEQLETSQKEAAINQLLEMTTLAELEVSVETLLQAKGFEDVVVTLTNDSADVVIARDELTDANRAQIEDTILRKTDISAENIVITPIQTAE